MEVSSATTEEVTQEEQPTTTTTNEGLATDSDDGEQQQQVEPNDPTYPTTKEHESFNATKDHVEGAAVEVGTEENGGDVMEGPTHNQHPPAQDGNPDEVGIQSFAEPNGLNKRARKSVLSPTEIDQMIRDLMPDLPIRAREKLRKAMCATGVSGNSQCAFFDHYDAHDETVLEKLSRDTIKFLCFARGIPTHKKGSVMVKKLVGGEVSEEDRGVDHNWSPSDYARLLLTMARPELRTVVDELFDEVGKPPESSTGHSTSSSRGGDKWLTPWLRITESFFGRSFQPRNPLAHPEILFQGKLAERGDIAIRRKHQDDLNKLDPSSTNWYRSDLVFEHGGDHSSLLQTKVAKLIQKKWFLIVLAIQTIKQRHKMSERSSPGTEYQFLSKCGVNISAGLFAVKLLELEEFEILRKLAEYQLHIDQNHDSSSVALTTKFQGVDEDARQSHGDSIERCNKLFENLETYRSILAQDFDELKLKATTTVTQDAIENMEFTRTKLCDALRETLAVIQKRTEGGQQQQQQQGEEVAAQL